MSESTLSFWGWGREEGFPDREERRSWMREVSERLGAKDLQLRDPPTLEEIRLPPGELRPPDSLASLCSRSNRARASHTYGKAYRDLVRGFRGDFDPAPDLVARPGTEQEVDDLLSWASGEGVAVIPFGGGTSVVGGVEADFYREGYRGVLSLDLRGMDRLLDLDERSRLARLQAGVTGPRLEEQLGRHGYTMRHYPQSYEFSTLGGWIATRSGGHYATVETHVDDLVQSTRTLTPSGPLETAEVPASGAGPNPDALICGSEGTLGVITRATVRIRRPPRHRARASVIFDRHTDAVEATRLLAQSRLFPVNCRLLDEHEVLLNRITSRKGAVLLVGFESEHESPRPDMERALERVREQGGQLLDEPVYRDRRRETPGDGGAEDRWRRSFFEAPYLFNVLVSMGVLVDTVETACTWRAFPDLHRAVREDVRAALEEVCGGGFVSSRFTHVYPGGPAPYYTFVAPARVGSELDQWREIKQAASEAILRHGGTITHHHAVGRVHRPWYRRETSPLYRAALRGAKEAVDPDGIMNPGVLLEEGPQRERM